MEEAWRANARLITFQMIPTTAKMRDRGVTEPGQHSAFFSFGSSGNVADFKDKVVQHGQGAKKIGLRRQVLRRAKKLEAALPDSIKNPLRSLADRAGVTGLLTQGRPTHIDPARANSLGEILKAGMNGRTDDLVRATSDFEKKFLASYQDQATIDVAGSFLHYSAKPGPKTIPLTWWAKPFPGNFGDWLSPLIISHYTDAALTLQSPVKPAAKKHIIALGSIGRFIKSNSVVLGTGISSDDIQLNPKADYVSVRGPITARVLKESGGPTVTAFGDPGIAISRIIPVTRSNTNGRIAFVRHFSHTSIPMQLPANVDELSVMMSKPEAIHEFVAELAKYDKVLTSAMHVMITCQSYGIPCGLVTFEGFEENVHGSGIKYADYAQGAGVEVMNPQVVGLDLRKVNLDALIKDITVSEAKKDEVEDHIRQALKRFGKK